MSKKIIYMATKKKSRLSRVDFPFYCVVQDSIQEEVENNNLTHEFFATENVRDSFFKKL